MFTYLEFTLVSQFVYRGSGLPFLDHALADLSRGDAASPRAAPRARLARTLRRPRACMAHRHGHGASGATVSPLWQVMYPPLAATL